MATRYEYNLIGTTTSISGNVYRGQTFTPASSHTIRMIKFLCNTNGAHTVEIFETSGGLPTGSAIASGIMSDGGFRWNFAGLGAGVALSAGVMYAIRIDTLWPPFGQGFRVSNANPYAGGTQFIANVVYYGYDKLFEEWDASFPYPPALTFPADEDTGISLTPTLQATYEHCESRSQTRAQWQIDASGGDFSSPIWDSGEDETNLLSIAVPSGNLGFLTTYDWRVKHRDTSGEWSEWADAYSFTTKDGDSPTITTQTCTSTGANESTGHGTITAKGDASVTQHGHCWDTSSSPTTSDSKTQNGAALNLGQFQSNITGLIANTLYYVRAYATNSYGTAYGSDVTITTSSAISGRDIGVRGTALVWFDEYGTERKARGTLVTGDSDILKYLYM